MSEQRRKTYRDHRYKPNANLTKLPKIKTFLALKVKLKLCSYLMGGNGEAKPDKVRCCMFFVASKRQNVAMYAHKTNQQKHCDYVIRAEPKE